MSIKKLIENIKLNEYMYPILTGCFLININAASQFNVFISLFI